jgi:hypothetical protein
MDSPQKPLAPPIFIVFFIADFPPRPFRILTSWKQHTVHRDAANNTDDRYVSE